MATTGGAPTLEAQVALNISQAQKDLERLAAAVNQMAATFGKIAPQLANITSASKEAAGAAKEQASAEKEVATETAKTTEAVKKKGRALDAAAIEARKLAKIEIDNNRSLRRQEERELSASLVRQNTAFRKSMQERMDIAGRASRMIQRQIAGAAVGLTSAVTVGAIGKTGFDFNAMLESNQMAFTVMLDSTEKSLQLANQLKQVQTTIGIGIAEGADSAKQLLAYGFKFPDLIQNLTMLKTVAGAVNVPMQDIVYVYGTLRSQGRAYTRDLMQFAMRGIPIFEALATTMKVPVAEIKRLTEEGKVGFDQVKAAMEYMTGSSGPFGGMLTARMDTLLGKIDLLGFEWQSFTGKLSKPLMLPVKDTIDTLILALRDLDAQPIAANLGSALETSLPSLRAFAEAVLRMGEAVSALIRDLAGPLGALVNLFSILAQWLSTIVSFLSPLIGSLAGVALGVAAVMKVLPTMLAMFKMFSPAIAAAATQVGVLSGALEKAKFDAAAAGVGKFGTAIKGLMGTVSAFLTTPAGLFIAGMAALAGIGVLTFNLLKGKEAEAAGRLDLARKDVTSSGDPYMLGAKQADWKSAMDKLFAGGDIFGKIDPDAYKVMLSQYGFDRAQGPAKQSVAEGAIARVTQLASKLGVSFDSTLKGLVSSGRYTQEFADAIRGVSARLKSTTFRGAPTVPTSTGYRPASQTDYEVPEAPWVSIATAAGLDLSKSKSLTGIMAQGGVKLEDIQKSFTKQFDPKQFEALAKISVTAAEAVAKSTKDSLDSVIMEVASVYQATKGLSDLPSKEANEAAATLLKQLTDLRAKYPDDKDPKDIKKDLFALRELEVQLTKTKMDDIDLQYDKEEARINELLAKQSIGVAERDKMLAANNELRKRALADETRAELEAARLVIKEVNDLRLANQEQFNSTLDAGSVERLVKERVRINDLYDSQVDEAFYASITEEGFNAALYDEKIKGINMARDAALKGNRAVFLDAKQQLSDLRNEVKEKQASLLPEGSQERLVAMQDIIEAQKESIKNSLDAQLTEKDISRETYDLKISLLNAETEAKLKANQKVYDDIQAKLAQLKQERDANPLTWLQDIWEKEETDEQGNPTGRKTGIGPWWKATQAGLLSNGWDMATKGALDPSYASGRAPVDMLGGIGSMAGGLAMAGGSMGISFLIEAFSKLSGVMKIFQAPLEMAAEILGPFSEALGYVLAPMKQALVPLLSSLKPIMANFAAGIQLLSALFIALSPVLDGINAVFTFFSDMLVGMVNVFIWVINVIRKAFGKKELEYAKTSAQLDRMAKAAEKTAEALKKNEERLSATMNYLEDQIKGKYQGMLDSTKKLFEVGAISATEYKERVKELNESMIKDLKQDELVALSARQADSLDELVKLYEGAYDLNAQIERIDSNSRLSDATKDKMKNNLIAKWWTDANAGDSGGLAKVAFEEGDVKSRYSDLKEAALSRNMVASPLVLSAYASAKKAYDASNWELVNTLLIQAGYAKGTDNITQDQIAMVHQGEGIVPRSFMEAIRSGDLTLSGPRGSTNGTQPVIVNVHVAGSVSTENDLADKIATTIARRQRSGALSVRMA